MPAEPPDEGIGYDFDDNEIIAVGDAPPVPPRADQALIIEADDDDSENEDGDHAEDGDGVGPMPFIPPTIVTKKAKTRLMTGCLAERAWMTQLPSRQGCADRQGQTKAGRCGTGTIASCLMAMMW